MEASLPERSERRDEDELRKLWRTGHCDIPAVPGSAPKETNKRALPAANRGSAFIPATSRRGRVEASFL